ncbi:hypothetical protein JCM3765_007332 [Sporobolomyces pararoseus]
MNELPPRSSTPFFRRSGSFSSASCSISSSSSNASDDDSDSDNSSSDNDSEYWSSSGSSSFRLSSSPNLRSSGAPRSQATAAQGPGGGSAQSRSSLKFSLCYIRARQSLASQSYDSLASSLRTLSSLLPFSSPSSANWESIAIFIPILERFSRDLAAVLSRDEAGSREFRRTSLGKDDAKALVALKQKWSRVRAGLAKGKGKGKEKESELDWIEHVQNSVERNPPPASFTEQTHLSQTTALLNSIESVLLPSCSIPRISLSNLALTSTQLSSWNALRHLEQVVEWYLSFSSLPKEETKKRAKSVLKGIKSLDLSRNSLSTFPSWLPELFPSLETLSLSHNQFYHLPPSIMLFSDLQRLRTHGNHLVHPEKALLPLRIDKKRESKRGGGNRANSKRIVYSLLRGTSSNTPSPATVPHFPSLFRISAEILLLSPSPSASDISLLPPHLSQTLSESYICTSCRLPILSIDQDSERFISEPLFERVHLVHPGISLPKAATRQQRQQHPTNLNSEEEREERDGGSLASFEQLLLLTIYNRYDSQPPPSSISSRRHDAGRSDKRGKNRGVPTLVIGGAGGGNSTDDNWRFCVRCAKAHLGITKISAHSIIVGISVDGVDKKDWSSVGQASSYMRVPSSNSPVKDLSSSSMACNDRGTTAVSGTLSVPAGATIEPQWWHAGDIGQDPIDGSHKGPLTTWISPLSANTKGNVWVQIASESFYSASSEWAVTRLNANKGKNKVVIPKSLAPGDYLVRFDLVGLHEAQSPGGAQFYPNCAQIKVTGSGSVKLPAGVAFPGFYTSSTPGIVYNIYTGSSTVGTDYVAPGTGVWDGTSSYSTETCKKPIDGLAPAGYCQSGSKPAVPSTSSTAPAVPSSTSKPSTNSPAPTSSSTKTQVGKPSSISTAIETTATTESSAAPVEPTSSPISSSPSSPSTKTSAGSTAPSGYADYSSCMRAYNKCLDDSQPKNGGPADFSSCNSKFNGCSSYRRRRTTRRESHQGRH